MVWPLPFRSSKDPESQQKDYDMTSPLSADGSNFPCKGYHLDGSKRSTAIFEAGDEYNMTLSGSATHSGGSCQLSLSYDNGATFKVIKSMIGGCPLESSYQFRIPDFAPSGDALFAWSWINHSGNREYYMNCAQIEIENPSSGDEGSLNGLPNIWVANLDSVNDCRVPEGTDVVYPNPSEDVEYGGQESSSSQAFAGNCEYPDASSTSSSADSENGAGEQSNSNDDGSNDDDVDDEVEPEAQPEDETGEPDEEWQYEPEGETEEMPEEYSGDGSDYRTNDRPGDDSNTQDGSYNENKDMEQNERPNYSPGSGLENKSFNSNNGQSEGLRDKDPAMFFEMPQASSPVAAPSDTAAERASPKPEEWQSSSSTYTTLMTSTIASEGSRPTASYASGDTSAYLPCVAGKLLCTDENNFVTCMGEGSSTYYSRSRAVAAGMLCYPYWAPPSNGGNPKEFYRDDRYVRVRPFGECAYNGALQCADAGYGMGSGFWICDHGGWIDMGRVAKGTMCVDGKIRST